MSTRKQQLNDLIRDKDFRREFVSDYVQEILAAQIKAIREHNEWTQQELGDAAEGMKQVQVSRLENPDYSSATINSLKRLAKAFDLGLIVRFVTFSEFVDQVATQSPARLVPPSYDDERQMSFADVPDSSSWITFSDYSPELAQMNMEPWILGGASGTAETLIVSSPSDFARSVPRDAKSEEVNALEGAREFAIAA